MSLTIVIKCTPVDDQSAYTHVLNLKHVDRRVYVKSKHDFFQMDIVGLKKNSKSWEPVVLYHPSVYGNDHLMKFLNKNVGGVGTKTLNIYKTLVSSVEELVADLDSECMKLKAAKIAPYYSSKLCEFWNKVKNRQYHNFDKRINDLTNALRGALHRRLSRKTIDSLVETIQDDLDRNDSFDFYDRLNAEPYTTLTKYFCHLPWEIMDDVIINIFKLSYSDNRRVASGLKEILHSLQWKEKDTKFKWDKVQNCAAQLLGEENIENLAAVVEHCTDVRYLNDGQLVLTSTYNGELMTFNILWHIEQQRRFCQSPDVDCSDPIQRQAIHLCIQGGTTIICGGPGRGETTICRHVAQYFDGCIALAPTNMAARRLGQSTRLNTRTIHSFYYSYKDFNWSGLTNYAKRDLNLPYDPNDETPSWTPYPEGLRLCLIVDEFSMVSTDVFRMALGALPPSVKSIVLVGDKDQLSPVDYGNPMKDLLTTERFKHSTIYLQHNYRINADSVMSRTIDKIAQGIPLTWRDFPKPETNIQKVGGILDTLTAVRLWWQRYNDPTTCQILSDWNKRTCIPVNKCIQELRAKSLQITPTASSYYQGDWLVCCDKIYDGKININNGQRGTYVGERQDDDDIILICNFDEVGEVELSLSMWKSHITLAYCITVHKSQGSEYQNVLVIVHEHSDLTTRNLLYTAFSRYRETLTVLVQGDNLTKNLEKQDRHRETNFRDILLRQR